ncbi:MAG TPA: DUF928 domain-containing protein [Cyanophyceae cyanobacterium]
MAGKTSVSWLRWLTTILCVEVLMFSIALPQIKAQPPIEISLKFPQTRDRGAPDRTVGAGVRSGENSCVTAHKPLAALVPMNNVWSTVSDTPTFFWYIPQTGTTSAELLILDDQNNEVYWTNFKLQGIPGVVQLTPPQTVVLKPGKDYTWYLALSCDPDNSTDTFYIQGLLERTELTAEQTAKLAQAKDPLNQAKVYADAQIWQESLVTLAKLRRDYPNDPKIAQEWKELLNSVQLGELASEPLADCCSPNSTPNN